MLVNAYLVSSSLPKEQALTRSSLEDAVTTIAQLTYQRHSILAMTLLRAATFLLIAGARAAQPSAPSPVAAPLRELPLGQLNFLATTDTHGWHAGHLLE